jgi:PST family polysaccharide transporter
MKGWLMRLKARPEFQRVLKGSAWLMVDRVAGMAVGLMVGLWVARYLAPEAFGRLQYALALVGIFSSLSGLGMDSLLVREMVAAPTQQDKGRVLGSALGLQALSGLLALALALAVVCLLAPSGSELRWVLIMACTGLPFMAGDTFDLYFQVIRKTDLTVKARLPTLLALAGLRVLLIQKHASLPAFALVAGLEPVFAAIAYTAVFFRVRPPETVLSFSLGRACALIREGWPSIFSTAAVLTYMKIDQVMLHSMAGDRATGLYSAVAKISELWYFVPVAVIQAAFPSMLEAKGRSLQDYHRRCQGLLDNLTMMAMSLALFISLTAVWVLKVLYGAAYLDGASMLTVHVWAGIFVCQGLVYGHWLTAAPGGLKRNGVYTLLGAVLNVSLNYVFIPRWQGYGAAWATVCAYAFVGGVCPAFHPDDRPFFHMILRSFLAPLRIFGGA